MSLNFVLTLTSTIGIACLPAPIWPVDAIAGTGVSLCICYLEAAFVSSFCRGSIWRTDELAITCLDFKHAKYSPFVFQNAYLTLWDKTVILKHKYNKWTPFHNIYFLKSVFTRLAVLSLSFFLVLRAFVGWT